MEGSTRHTLRILDQYGDTKLTYDPTDQDAVRDVERRFNALMARSFVAFDVSSHPGRVMTAFDPAATEIIIAPRIAGG
jgi:hypothetical protein